MNRFSTVHLLNVSGSSRATGHLAYQEALLHMLRANGSLGDATSPEIDFELPEVFSDGQRIATDQQEMKSKDYTDGPGELDMMLGFFIMNGACIVFFLMFGMCVICSCMRRRPRFLAAKQSVREKPKRLFPVKTASPKLSGAAAPMLKPKFKSIVSGAIRSGDLKRIAAARPCTDAELGGARRCSGTSERSRLLRRCSECPSKKEEFAGSTSPRAISPANGQVVIQVEPPCPDFKCSSRCVSAVCSACHPPAATPPDHVCDCDCDGDGDGDDKEAAHDVGAMVLEEPEAPSVIRQNLLGPLSFDDLYYT